MDDSFGIYSELERFEAAWQSGQPPRLAEFLPAADQVDPLTRRELLFALVGIDLEHRWTQPDLPTTRPQEDLPARPRLEDYQARFADVANLDEFPVDLIRAEFRARKRAGENASALEYLKRFPRHSLQLALEEIEDEFSQAAELKIYDETQVVHSTHLGGPLELGRQSQHEPPPFARLQTDTGDRLIIAPLEETTTSRHHARLELSGDGRLQVTNLSAKRPLFLSDGTRVNAGESCELPRGVAVQVGKRTVRVEQADDTSALELLTLAAPTMVPGKEAVSPITSVQQTLTASGRPDVESLIRWFQAAMHVVHSAAGSPDFFEKAAREMVKLVQLDSAAVLLWEDRNWAIKAYHSARGKEAASWRPSQTMLSRVRREKRTFWHVPQAASEITASLRNVEALVAAPILDRHGSVIGAVYGDRRGGLSGSGPRISQLEAMFVELLACGVAAGLARLKEEKAAVTARVKYEQHVTPKLAAFLEQNPDWLAGRDREVTILFCDIRGFSRISERVGPATTVAWINATLERLSQCVLEHDGVLVDYIGDELMAMWGALQDQPSHASLACRTGLKMLDCLPELNARWEQTIGEPIQIGVGINTGVAYVGDIGSAQKMKIGALGNPVNVASRVQGTTKYLQTPLLITGSTQSQLEPGFCTRRICQARMVNIEEPVHLFELAGDANDTWTDLQARYEQALDHLERGQLREASRILGNLLMDFPEDGPTLVLMSRAVSSLVDGGEPCQPVWETPGK